MTKIKCPVCGQDYKVRERAVGKEFKCLKCGISLLIRKVLSGESKVVLEAGIATDSPKPEATERIAKYPTDAIPPISLGDTVGVLCLECLRVYSVISEGVVKCPKCEILLFGPSQAQLIASTPTKFPEKHEGWDWSECESTYIEMEYPSPKLKEPKHSWTVDDYAEIFGIIGYILGPLFLIFFVYYAATKPRPGPSKSQPGDDRRRWPGR